MQNALGKYTITESDSNSINTNNQPYFYFIKRCDELKNIPIWSQDNYKIDILIASYLKNIKIRTKNLNLL